MRQQDKEEAVLLALQDCKALVRRDLTVYAMDKDGNLEKVSESDNYDDIWSDALHALQSA